jgi:two-component system chemotaxis response regulator CheY
MRVLIVDDDILFTRLVKTRLESWGHNVSILLSGEEAYQRIRKEPVRVVIVDSELEGIDGPAMCERIRQLERSRYIYIIVYGETPDKDRMVAALKAGADDFIVKPFNPIELRLRLENAKRLLNLEDELREGGGTDAVTGMVNLTSFQQFFSVVLAESRRTNTVGALMFLEVPDFQSIFEENGYIPAHTLMSEIARIIRRSVRTSDVVARIDDDLFCVMLQNTFWDKCRPLAEKFAERIQNSVVFVEEMEIRPKVIISTTNYPVSDMPANEILQYGERISFEP